MCNHNFCILVDNETKTMVLKEWIQEDTFEVVKEKVQKIMKEETKGTILQDLDQEFGFFYDNFEKIQRVIEHRCSKI